MGLWRISKDTHQPLHRSMQGIAVNEYPFTLSYVIKKRMQIDSYNELPEDKRPPRDIWDKPSELEEWFDRVYSHGEKQTEFTLPKIKGDEVE